MCTEDGEEELGLDDDDDCPLPLPDGASLIRKTGSFGFGAAARDWTRKMLSGVILYSSKLPPKCSSLPSPSANSIPVSFHALVPLFLFSSPPSSSPQVQLQGSV